ncbi:flagellar type III secretion system pore protein FliP [Allohahella marinimesophila]|uniref:Flagellar biosynthetic protein FliP n=1 Tax=Allohahella marinimesophila TaxID=1054972 RepID=A0ABP7PP84_9GAMM
MPSATTTTRKLPTSRTTRRLPQAASQETPPKADRLWNGPLTIVLIILALIAGTWSSVGHAAIDGLPAVNLTTNPDGTQSYSVTLQILLVMTALTFIPAFIMMMTSFTRIIIVFSILRQALGLQQTPSNQIIVGLTLFLTFFIMTPVFNVANEKALQPYLNEELSIQDAFVEGVKPFKSFMLAQTRESDLDLFIRLAREDNTFNDPQDVPLNILLPAFVTSELKTAFQMGFMIFIPFLIIDMVVASVLMAMGMMMLSPLIISLPFKIMLFVLVDGWALIMGTLAASFAI